MGGKAALLVVLGFSSIMLIVGLNMNRVSTSAVENSTSYFESGRALEIARSGINLAASNLSRNNSWQPNGKYSYLGTDNLEISLVKNVDITTVTSTGTHQDVSKSIEVKIELYNFSEFAYFSDTEGDIWWTGNDSVWGPFHTNDDIQFQNHPYFDGPSTSHGGSITYYDDEEKDAPIIKGQYDPGMTLEIPPDAITDLAGSAASNGYTFSGESEVFLEFAGDSIKYKYDKSDPYTTVLGTDLAPNGVIYVHDGKLRIQGIVKGQWSVGTNKDVYIDDDIVYYDVPDVKDDNDPSLDLLGIIAKKDVKITENSANDDDVNIHAAIFCQEGSFEAEDYENRDKSGTINLIGGITQDTRGAVGTFKTKKVWNWTTWKYEKILVAVSGYDEKNYQYDPRLKHLVPPYFPSTGKFKVLSWLE